MEKNREEKRKRGENVPDAVVEVRRNELKWKRDEKTREKEKRREGET